MTFIIILFAIKSNTTYNLLIMDDSDRKKKSYASHWKETEYKFLGLGAPYEIK